MNRDEFIERHPQLFHMAAEGSWLSIQERGLLSTRALVDLYKPTADLRYEILNQVRKKSYVLTAPELPNAIVRDQRPLKFIDQCLLPDVSLQEFLDALNGRVFFHVRAERLERLLGAKNYRGQVHDILTVDTATLLDMHHDVELAPYNTGSVHVPNMPRRGPSTFTPLENYPIAHWVRKRGEKDAIVELTVNHSADVSAATLEVSQWHNGERI